MKRFVLTAALAALSCNALADADAAMEKPYIFASQSASMNAVVVAINHETRALTLRGPEGNAVSMVAGENVRNLDQVNIGDVVSASYQRTLSIEVMPGDGSEPGAGGMTAAARAAKGDLPAGVISDAKVVTASVEEIDLEANTFKLKFPGGDVQQFTARDPENLKRAAVGDMVVITTTETLALTVNESPVE
jgi:hypothetical protein